jgi:DNA-binding NarL/FixJ family response regulator
MSNADSGLTHSSAENAPKRILLVDDHPVFRHGLSEFISRNSGLTVCGHADSAPHALAAMRELNPDFAIVDVSLPGTNGIELIKLMKAEQPRLSILVMSMHDESIYALRALKAGASGYIMKSEAINHVINAIHRVLEGKIFVSPRFSEQLIFKAIQSLDSGVGSSIDLLTDRELEVLELLGRGKGTRAIANSLHLSVKTIETHRAHIKEKLSLRDSNELTKFAVEWVARNE